jgi:hypothetical protein
LEEYPLSSKWDRFQLPDDDDQPYPEREEDFTDGYFDDREPEYDMEESDLQNER